MDLAHAYIYIYLFIVTIATFNLRKQYANRRDSVIYKENRFVFLALVLFCILFIGLRPHSGVFVDTMNYVAQYHSNEGTLFVFDPKAENVVFDNLFSFFASQKLGIDSFFVLISFVYFGTSAIAIKRLFHNDSTIAYLVYLAAFSTFSYATNGIKAGAAASVFLLALSFREKIIPCIIIMIITIGMHHSMIVPVTAFISTLIFKKPKYFFYGWIFSVVMATLHVGYFQFLFAGFSDERGAGYLGAGGYDDTSYLTGFRLDFLIYSAMPVWVGYIAKFKKNIQSKIYDTLLYTYITTNAVWMLCMYASFTNRIAYLSWCIYPIVLIYPFLNENWGGNRYKTFSNVIIYHLGFTLFMQLVYYQFIHT